MRAALIAVDVINGCFDGWPDDRRDRLVGKINELTRGLRGAGADVIWVRQEFEDDMHDAFLEMRDKGIRKYARGTSDCQLVTGLDVQPGDEVLIKKRYSAFFGTDLDARLARRPVSHLVLAGVNTHACIRATAVDAYQRDWRILFAVDCIASYDLAHHAVSMAYMNGKIGVALDNPALLEFFGR